MFDPLHYHNPSRPYEFNLIDPSFTGTAGLAWRQPQELQEQAGELWVRRWELL